MTTLDSDPVCIHCGARVADTLRHAAWHDAIGPDFDKAIVRAVESAATRIHRLFDSLGDEVERIKAGQSLLDAHCENLIERVYTLEDDGATAPSIAGVEADIDRVSERVSDLALSFEALQRHVSNLDSALDVMRDHAHSVGAGGAMSGHIHTMSPPTVSHSHGRYTATPSSPF
jgi:phage shock protein A